MTGAGRLSEEQVLAIGRGLLLELARVHEAGAVCGVVGPSSVLVDDAGGVHLAQGAGVDQAYASPEVLTGQPATPRSDLYSAAALLAHLFRGEPTLPPRVDDLDPGIGWLLGPVLVADPAARPGSAADMVRALDQLAEQRHGQDWRAGVLAFGVVGGAGAVPLLALASGGTASAAGVAGVAGAAGSGAAAGALATGVAGSAAGATATGAGGSAAGAAGAGGFGASGAGATGASQAAASGVVAPQGAVGGLGAAAPGAGAPAAAGGAAPGSVGAGQGVVGGGGAQAGGHTAHVAGGISKGVALKVGAVAAAGVVGVGGATAAVVLLTGSETHQVTVAGTSDIYLAGADADTTALISDPGTAPVKVDVDGAGKVSFGKVSGKISACDGCVLESPDGGEMSFATTGISAFNGIAGVAHESRTLFLVGVFAGDDQPDQPDDAVVDLTGANDDGTQDPDLGEPFFVGDGRTADGDAQEVEVPDGAQTLYLGFADAFGFVGVPGAYGDNQGSVSLEVEVD